MNELLLLVALMGVQQENQQITAVDIIRLNNNYESTQTIPDSQRCWTTMVYQSNGTILPRVECI